MIVGSQAWLREYGSCTRALILGGQGGEMRLPK